MFMTIFKLLGNVIGIATKVFDFFQKKDLENQIRKGYEEEKKAYNLEQDKIAKEKIDESKEKVSDTNETIEAIDNANIKDAELTDDEIKKEIDKIEFEDKKRKREKEIEAAKELKKRKQITKTEILNNEKFNDGDEIEFEG